MEFFLFIIGTILGSFLNVIIYRLPKGLSIITPSSRCPKCNTPIKPHHNIPILSYIFLKGRCAYCNEKISIQYPLVEIFSGILAILIYKKIGEIDIFFVITYAVFLSYLSLSVIDIHYKAVPDSLNLFALTLSIFNNYNILENLTNALILMGAMSAIRFYVSYFIKKEAMGEGDVILAGSMGALLGVKLSLMAIFLASLIALLPSIYSKKSKELPFIPFLAIATFIVWYFDSFFLDLWRELYG